MESLTKLLKFINDNWTFIITLIGLGIAIYTKIRNYIKLSKEEKVEIAINQLRSTCLNLVVEAEKEYKSDTGKIKRSKVLNEIYNSYPVLKDYSKQEDIEKILDDIIDKSLDKMKETLENNEEFKKLIYGKEEG